MKQVKILAALGMLGLAGVANAGVTSTWTVTNDYDFRGNTQSAKDPALQASIDYAHDSGFAVGAWASNVDFGDSPKTKYELDVYAGYSKTFDSGFGWNAGVIDYTYSRHTYDYQEIYAGVSYKWISGKLFYSPKFGGDYAEGYAKANPPCACKDVAATYVSVDATIPLPASFSVIAHAGASKGDYWDNVYGDDLLDYAVGVGYTAGKFNLALKFVGTSSDVKVKSDAFNNESRVVFTVATTLPW